MMMLSADRQPEELIIRLAMTQGGTADQVIRHVGGDPAALIKNLDTAIGQQPRSQVTPSQKVGPNASPAGFRAVFWGRLLRQVPNLSNFGPVAATKTRQG